MRLSGRNGPPSTESRVGWIGMNTSDPYGTINRLEYFLRIPH